MLPGAPNRPPASSGAPAPADASSALPDAASRVILRRLVPSQVALLQDSWKGSVAPELLVPFEKAEAAYQAGDLASAASALDQLAIRFAEPRWPSLAEPFRSLRVPIPAPVPPHWDPDHGLSAEERETRRARRAAEAQVALASASVAWAAGHGIDTATLSAHLARAQELLGANAPSPEVLAGIDSLWESLRGSLPRPGRGARPPPPFPDPPAKA